jgi:ABC-type branched-subunit amino acid transport system substrate-binding protein/outer membrane protein assembly factor BamD (BamD/ComL family)
MKRHSWIAFILVVIAVAATTSCSTPSRQPDESTLIAPASGPPPSEAEKLWRQAEQHRKSGNTARAISSWERIAQTYPDNVIAARALYQLGHIYLEQGQPDRAMQFIEYLIYMYPKWDDINLAQVDRLRALWAMGKKKQVMKEATALWNASNGQPEVQAGLSLLMASAYKSEGEVDTAFEWAGSGFAHARSPEEKKSLTKATLEVLSDMNESVIRKLMKKNPDEFMRVFLDFRQAQLEMQEGEPEAARDRFRALLSRNPTHPIVPEVQAALRGTPSEVALPLNPDRVGCMLPLNGSYGKYGQMVMRGLGLANQDWAERYPDQRISLVVRDAQNEPELAIRSFEELTKNEGVLAIVGPLGSQSAKAVAPMANKWNVPMLALTQKEDEMIDNAYVLHIFLDNRELLRTLVKHCREKLGYSRFAALYPDDRYGQKLSKIFAEVVKEQGGNLLASIPYKEKGTDFKDSIQKLMNVAKQNVPPSGVDATPFEALFIPDQVQTVSLIAPQLPYYNVIGATLLGTNLWGEGPLVQVGGSYVEQALFATPFYAESQSPRVRAFRERYQAVYHTQPSYLEAQAYDALMLFFQARSTLRSAYLDRTSLLQNLLQIRGYEGVAGTYSFLPDGELKRDYLLFQVLNGQLTQLSQ